MSRRAIEIVAENRIREAMAEGKFDNLPGLGRPIPDLDEPYDPDWWVKRWIVRERLKGVLSGKEWEAARRDLRPERRGGAFSGGEGAERS